MRLLPFALNPSWKVTSPCGRRPSNERAKNTSCGTPAWTIPATFSNPNFLYYCGCPTRQQPLAPRSFNRDTPSWIRALPIPIRWHIGSTESGPGPYQLLVPSEMATGENAICPTTRPPTSATCDQDCCPSVIEYARSRTSLGKGRAFRVTVSRWTATRTVLAATSPVSSFFIS
jgi:hypothetical protein